MKMSTAEIWNGDTGEVLAKRSAQEVLTLYKWAEEELLKRAEPNSTITKDDWYAPGDDSTILNLYVKLPSGELDEVLTATLVDNSQR